VIKWQVKEDSTRRKLFLLLPSEDPTHPPPSSSSSTVPSSLIAIALISSSHIAVHGWRGEIFDNQMQQFEQSSSSANFLANACNSEQLILVVQDLGWGGNCVKTQLYCSSRHLICMHWLQIKLQRSILPKATIHGSTNPIENILPDICCHTYVAKYCHQQVKGWCTKQLEYIAILQLLSFLKLQNPLVPSFLLCKPAQHQLMLCHLPFYFVQLFRRQICLFFISFSLIPSMCPSILFLQK